MKFYCIRFQEDKKNEYACSFTEIFTEIKFHKMNDLVCLLLFELLEANAIGPSKIPTLLCKPFSYED